VNGSSKEEILAEATFRMKELYRGAEETSSATTIVPFLSQTSSIVGRKPESQRYARAARVRSLTKVFGPLADNL